ncbi:hypothetical protein ABFP60_10280 [Clostridioides difficile]
MKSKKGKYLILTLSIFILIGSITILPNKHKGKDNSNLISEEVSKSLIEDKSNLIVENDNNNVVTTEEEEDGSVRVLPDNKSEGIIVLPNPNSDEQVTLKKL